jgi:hypothetical protein
LKTENCHSSEQLSKNAQSPSRPVDAVLGSINGPCSATRTPRLP